MIFSIKSTDLAIVLIIIFRLFPNKKLKEAISFIEEW
jgi:Sec-independent protein translocase protein TatA